MSTAHHARQTAELLVLLREEFSRIADELDVRLVDWLGDEAASPGSQAGQSHAEALAGSWLRMAEALRVLSLEGLAQLLEQLADTARMLAISDEDSLATGLSWLLGWHAPMAQVLADPGEPEAAQALLEFVREGPFAPDEAALHSLAELLRQPALLLHDEQDDTPQHDLFAPADPEDVSLMLPDDLDIGLFDTFLHDAPQQAAQLAQAARELVQHALPEARLREVQRCAHTFKGSGNIIGLRGIAQMAHRIEDLLDFCLRQGGQLPRPMALDVMAACHSLEQMVAALRGEDNPPQPQQALAQLNALIDWARTISDGSWSDWVAMLDSPALEPANPGEASVPAAQVPAPQAQAPVQQAVAPPVAPTAPTAPAAANPLTPEASARMPMARLDRLVRQAGQCLVQHSQFEGLLDQLGSDLGQLHTSHELLERHLQGLLVQVQRQRVGLAGAGAGPLPNTYPGAPLAQPASPQDFDPLELDRYTELHSVTQLLAEQISDAQRLSQALRQQLQHGQQQLREHGLRLKDQHEALMQARLVPFRQITARLQRNVSQTAASTGKQVRLEIEGESLLLDSDLLEQLAEPLLHLLRNAVDHGIEPAEQRRAAGKADEGCIRLVLSRDGQSLRLTCTDDGQGLDTEAIRAKALALGLLDAQANPSPVELQQLILLPGFSTREHVTHISGRGVGLDVVAQRIQAASGRLSLRSQPGQGCCFTIELPASSGSQHTLLVRVGPMVLGLPTRSVQQALTAAQLQQAQTPKPPEARLHDWLALPAQDEAPPRSSAQASNAYRPGLAGATRAANATEPAVVVVHGMQGEVALHVDQVLQARELIVQDVGELLRHIPGLVQGALNRQGQVLLVFEPAQLEAHARAAPQAAARQRLASLQPPPVWRQRVLVVDDSLSARQSVGQLLADEGWQVAYARDGVEALELLGAHPDLADVVLTDLEMPRLNGLELTRQLRADPRWQTLPVLMLTSRSSDKHRASAREYGVNDYLTKPCPDAELLARLQAALPTRSADSSRAASSR